MQKEINKLLKKIGAEKLKNNHKECIELYNIVGGLYSDIGSYDEAVHYHEQALGICKTLGDCLGTAMALRYIGEAKASLGQFYQAIDCTKKYLDLAQKSGNKVEIQRAWTTLGRIYLMQAQDMKDKSNYIDESIKNACQEAEKKFQTALNLTGTVRDQVDEKEYAQMNSSLLINIGLIKDICGMHEDSVLKFRKAIEICKGAKLKEDLYRCQIILAGIYRQRSNITMAVRLSEDALTTAKQIGKKILICEAYLEKGLVKILQRDFKAAKRLFAQAYLEKSPNEEDHSKSIRLTKLSHLISTTYDKVAQDGVPAEAQMKLCDKLGDLFTAIDCYKLAIEFYKRAFTAAKLSSKSRGELARILFSIAESYADNGQFEHAMVCYEKELAYRNGNAKEQCQSLIKIAHMCEYLDDKLEKVCEAYEKAYQKAGDDPKLLYDVLKYYIPYLKKKSSNTSRLKRLENTMLSLKCYPEITDEIAAEGNEESNDLEDEITNVDDIISDDDGDDEVLMIGRRKAKGVSKFKPNEVGDTPLHEACIKGDLKRVESLIRQGHEVNPRDNAGWIPLHEACNHGHYRVAEYLIENGADVCNRGLKGVSPLHDAATNGHFDIMRLLIKHGANVIALTDTGETVLSCLRDYKQRNYTEMSNRAMCEYKQIEAELLNIMDKRGFNLMEESMKNLGSRNNSSRVEALLPTEIRTYPRKSINLIEAEPESNPVKDYCNVIGTLKRKRLDERSRDENKKVNLPAVYNTGQNTSAPTKEWLIDDVSREKRIMNRRSNMHNLVELEDDHDEEEPELGESSQRFRSTPEAPEMQDEREPQASKSRVSHRKNILDSDDENQEDKEDVIVLEESNRRSSPEFLTSHSPFNENLFSRSSMSVRSTSPASLRSPPARARPLTETLGDTLVVSIEDRKILVPVKSEFTTVRCLKDLIIERYSALIDARPNISLALASDPTCFLSDGDLCKDVVRENLVAIIDSWQLPSIEESYLKGCIKANLDPSYVVSTELQRIGEFVSKLDLSFKRFPQSHVKAVAGALARRDFVHANLTGSNLLAEQGMMDSLATWRGLVYLEMKCVGMRRNHFETICTSSRLAELRNLNVSFNSILYKCQKEFKSNMESLRTSCPKLKRLDVRKNQLQFVKSIGCNNKEKGRRSEFEGANETLDFMLSTGGDLEILGLDQNEYSVYSA